MTLVIDQRRDRMAGRFHGSDNYEITWGPDRVRDAGWVALRTPAGPPGQETRTGDIMLMRFDPFRQLENVTQVLNRQAAAMRAQSMPMDAYREGDRFIVKFDLAGVDPSSIDLTVERNEVTVSAERSWEPTEEQQVVIAERPQGKFTRQLFLGDSLDVDNIQASYEHGVLTLEIPVSEQAKPRKIEVSASEGTETVPAGSST